MGVITSARESTAKQEANQIVLAIETVATGKEATLTANSITYKASYSKSGLTLSENASTNVIKVSSSETSKSETDISTFQYFFERLLNISDGIAVTSFPTTATSNAKNISNVYGTISAGKAVVTGFEYTLSGATATGVFGNNTIDDKSTSIIKNTAQG